MSKPPYTKAQITAAVRNELEKKHPSKWDYDVDKLMGMWWVTKRSDRGYQLTDLGHTAFEIAEVESETRIFTGSTYNLNCKMTVPYWVIPGPEQVKRSIVIYDSRLVLWIDLVGGLDTYIRSIDDKIPV